jgi:hypothetical protein
MSTNRTPQTRSLKSLSGRIGAYAMHAKHDARETTKAGRIAFARKFFDEVDPDRKLPEAERYRRATAAKKAYFARLALMSAKARRRPTPARRPPTDAA